MKLNGRLIIFCLLTVAQTAVVLMLSSWGNLYVKNKLTGLVLKQVMADNITFTQQLESSIEKLKLYDLRVGADDWKVLQDIVEQTKVPNDGFLCVLDLDTNRLICHPDFKESPEMSEAAMPIWETLTKKGKMVSFQGKKVVRTGKVKVGEEVHWVAGRNLGDFNVALLAHQKQGEIDLAVANSAFLVSKLTVVICAIGLFMTTIFGLAVVWRTEKKIAEANEEVERLIADRPVNSRAFADSESELVAR